MAAEEKQINHKTVYIPLTKENVFFKMFKYTLLP